MITVNMNSEETDFVPDCVTDNEMGDGAVGNSPVQDRCFPYAFGELSDPVYQEEANEIPFCDHEASNFFTNERRRRSSYCLPHENTEDVTEDGGPLYRARRHSFSSATMRRQSDPSPTRSSPCSCYGSVARQISLPRRFDHGLRRRVSSPISSEMLRAIQLQRSSSSALPLDCHTPNEIARMSSDLFLLFLTDELEHAHIQLPQWLSRLKSQFPRDSEFQEMGSHLRSMADEFTKSEQRIHVRQRADSVIFNNLDFSSFSDLLFGIFQEGGVTSERVLVLFTFCTDLAIRALREKLQARFLELTQWSQQYIMSRLSPWVHCHGGWAAVLQRSVNEVYKVAVIGVCFMGMVAFWIYIRNNCR